jgi:hypothetical protein
MNALARRYLRPALVFGGLAGLPLAADAQFQTPPNSAALYASSQTQATTQVLAAPLAPSFGYVPPAWGWGAPPTSLSWARPAAI